jgi:RHS repeat-associated protein
VKKWVRYGGVATGDESRVYLDGLSERHRWATGGGGQSHVLNVLDGNKRLATARVGDRHPDDLGPPVRFELGDHLGSVALTTDDTGAWTNREEYFPYGETSFGSFARKRYRFTGMERDEESGLAYHGARYYSPAYARWASVDPFAVRRHGESYGYVRRNPLSSFDPDGAYERDMHQLGVYYVLRARGYNPGLADRIAGYSQFVDEDPTTEPVRTSPVRTLSVGVNPGAVRSRVFFHFIGSTATTPTVRNDPQARRRVTEAFAGLRSEREQERAQSQILAGTASHTFLDTFSHEGFTGHASADLNTRTDTWRLPRAGHVDAAEGGHAPDRPYNDVDKALEALHALYDLVPEGTGSKPQSWYAIEFELRIALSARQPNLADRMATMSNLIRNRFGDTVNLDMSRFEAEGPMYRGWVDTWRWSTEKAEAATPAAPAAPAVPVAPLR